MNTTHPAILGYRRFLEGRDGAPDLFRSTLERREAFYGRIEAQPVLSRRRPDREVFLRNLRRERFEPGLDERMLWLLSTAKTNRAERFGVELGQLYGRGPSEDAEPERKHVVLQETYHTRTLADVVGMFGLPVPQGPPGLLPRLMIHVLVFNPFPEQWMLPLVCLSEMVGCVSFRLLRDRGLELFADEPEVCERIRLLFDEILADEICHVGLCEARIGLRARRLVHRAFHRIGARMVARMAPGFVELMGRVRIDAEIARPFLQAELAAEFPGAAYAF